MKNKITVLQMSDRIKDLTMWVIILLFSVFFILVPSQSKAETLEAVEVTEMVQKPKYKYRNDNVNRYHKANNKRFQCSACPKRKFLGIFNRK